jgi:hypothetical protein
MLTYALTTIVPSRCHVKSHYSHMLNQLHVEFREDSRGSKTPNPIQELRHAKTLTLTRSWGIQTSKTRTLIVYNYQDMLNTEPQGKEGVPFLLY